MKDQIPNPIMKAVKSSNLAFCGHCAKTNTLGVTFKGGGKYQYAGVPREVYEKMMAAESIGKFLNSRIKGKYEFTKI